MVHEPVLSTPSLFHRSNLFLHRSCSKKSSILKDLVNPDLGHFPIFARANFTCYNKLQYFEVKFSIEIGVSRVIRWHFSNTMGNGVS